MTLSTPPGFLPIGQDIWLVDADKEQSDADDSQPTYVSHILRFGLAVIELDTRLILIFGWSEQLESYIKRHYLIVCSGCKAGSCRQV